MSALVGGDAASPRETTRSDRPSKAAPPYFTILDNHFPMICAGLTIADQINASTQPYVLSLMNCIRPLAAITAAD
jgi:hypothetical protein